MNKLLIAAWLFLPGLNFAQTSEDIRFQDDNISDSAYDPDIRQSQPAQNDGISSVFDCFLDLNREDPGDLSIRLSGNSILIEGSGPISRAAYRNGDVAFLTGYLQDDWTREEWKKYYNLTKRLVRDHFRIIVNPKAGLGDIRAAVQDDRTAAIIWSSHANEDGRLFDSKGNTLPRNIFSKNAGKKFKQLIISACSGDAIEERYEFPEGLFLKHWTGPTDTKDLFGFLNKWDPLEMK